MAVFNYVAVNENGKTRKGILEGDSVSHIRKALIEKGLMPIEVTLVTQDKLIHPSQTTVRSYFTRKQRISITQLAIITYQFSTLLSAGMPVESALASIAAEIEKASVKQVILGVRDKVMEGHTLASGMSEFPNVFPKLYIATVTVGEKTGQLDKVLNRLADYYEKQRAIQEKIFAALIYPTLLTIVASAIIIFLLTYVIPQVISVFTQTGAELPEVTIILIFLTDMLRLYGLYALLFIFLCIILFRYSLRYTGFRYRVHLLLLKIPVINSTIIAINAARFSRTFGILFASGVPVLDAMNSANSIISLMPMRDAINTAIASVGEGASIHQSLQKTGYFSSLSNQLIASGETSGELEIMLEKAAMFQEQITSSKLNIALTLFEPILILTMGGIVLFIVLAVLLPIFEMNQLIH